MPGPLFDFFDLNRDGKIGALENAFAAALIFGELEKEEKEKDDDSYIPHFFHSELDDDEDEDEDEDYDEDFDEDDCFDDNDDEDEDEDEFDDIEETEEFDDSDAEDY